MQECLIINKTLSHIQGPIDYTHLNLEKKEYENQNSITKMVYEGMAHSTQSTNETKSNIYMGMT